MNGFCVTWMQVSGDMRLLKGVRLPGFKPKVPEKPIPLISTRSWRKNTFGYWLVACVYGHDSIGVQLCNTSSIPGSAPQEGLSHWATSDEEMERGLGECIVWMWLDDCTVCMVENIYKKLCNTKVDIFLPEFVDMYLFYKEMDSDLQGLSKIININFHFYFASHFYLFYLEKSGKLIWKSKWKR